MSANFCPALALLEHHCVPIVGRNLGYPVTGSIDGCCVWRSYSLDGGRVCHGRQG